MFFILLHIFYFFTFCVQAVFFANLFNYCFQFVIYFHICCIFGSAGRAEPFKSAAPVSQSGVSRRVRPSLGLLQTPDLRRTPPYPPTRAGSLPFADPRTLNIGFWADVLPIEIDICGPALFRLGRFVIHSTRS